MPTLSPPPAHAVRASSQGARRGVRGGLLATAALLCAFEARANDLGEALEFAGALAAIETDSPADDDHALAMLNSRDVVPGAALEHYDCASTVIDAAVVFRTSGFLRDIDRRCREAMWTRDVLPGYRTLGQVRLSAGEVRPWIREAAIETEIPETILDTIIKYESGYRPGVISERGEVGLMQLRPEVIAEMNLADPLDGRANVRAGARYLARLLDHFDGVLEPALAAFKLGIAAVEREGGITPNDRTALWFVREVRRIYKAEVDRFPIEQAAADITYVMTWTEH